MKELIFKAPDGDLPHIIKYTDSLTEEEMNRRVGEREHRYQSPMPMAIRETSPSGFYILDIYRYETGIGTWDYTKGVVTDVTDKVIAEVKRNYPGFHFAFIQHPNGNEYLLCGEDYQGYTVINLTLGTKKSYLPQSALAGAAFCWSKCFPSPDGLSLAVHGCYWGAPYDVVIYDFSKPDEMPLPILEYYSEFHEFNGWSEDGTRLLGSALVFKEDDSEEVPMSVPFRHPSG